MLLLGEKLKVCLTQQDMQELGLSYQSMDYKDPQTKAALIYILEKAKDETGFSPKDAKLFIEVYPHGEDGCVLYFTTIARTVRQPDGELCIEPVLFAFADADALISGAANTFKRYGHRIYKSALYRLNGKYRLIVYPLDYSDRLSAYFLTEYGNKIGEGELLCAYTREHGERIIAENALEILTEYF